MLDELLSKLDKKRIKYKYSLFNSSCCGDYHRVDFEVKDSSYSLAVNEVIKITKLDSPKIFISMSGEMNVSQIMKLITFIDKL